MIPQMFGWTGDGWMDGWLAGWLVVWLDTLVPLGSETILR